MTFQPGSGKGEDGRGNTACLEMEGNPFTIVEQLMDYWRGPVLPELPRFYGGAVGYFAYDLVRWLERLPSTTRDDLDLPDMILSFTGTLLVMDHLRHTLQVVVNTLPGSRPEVAYRQAVEHIEHIWRLINGPLCSGDRPADGFYGSLREGDGPAPGGDKKPMNKAALQEPPSSVTREEFCSLVCRAKEYIRQGDILQVVLSQRLQVPFAGDPFQVYRRLRRINPSPYLYYLDLGDVAIAGSSPEMLVRVENGVAETRPIAGTRPRGASVEADEALAAELLADPKERAEHVMLVDLGRNDLGRVCLPGTVTVPQFMVVEKYSHVMHLVSAVRGNLAEGWAAFDALKACFPAGTVSGAPKVRAMEIIEELEPVSRGPYAGAVGYLGYNGNLDTAITIRTIVFHRGYAYVQAGAGIVADSDPEREYQETLNKARALLQTLAAGENPSS
ncbi:MAG: chorismate-binding protein [Thermoanaerobacteraceae bacterium]|nr:chorismate-binding protein [Thermoanaerobacteraceae bacterium]